MTADIGEVRTTCPYCGVGCGLVAQRGEDGVVALRGDESHPSNFGRLCSKGAALGETIDFDGRLLAPEIDGRQVDWNTALDKVAAGLAATIQRHGPDSVAFYVSGQLLTEDYYVANKLMKGFIGSANIDTNSRLCMASSVAGHKRAFGSDTVPGCYEDLERADLIVLVGSNAAWCHPVLYQRIAARKADGGGPRVVVVDPRRTATCDLADLHLPLQPGSDVILFNGLLVHLAAAGHCDRAYIETAVDGFEEALDTAREAAPSIDAIAASCDLAPDAVRKFFHWFAETPRTVTAYSQGVNQSSAGTDKVNAIINCHLATGRIGIPGCGPFSLTGQPNAMGGREVGGLANQLAAHMELNNPAHRGLVQRFWESPRIADRPGHKAVELFRAIGRGDIKAVWIMSTNPMVSLPNSDIARAALESCPLVIVSDCVRRTDTNAFAHILLPAAAWGEKGGTVTNSERRISRQRSFLKATGDARPDWWIICQVARRMGFGSAFGYDGPASIFREHAALSGYGNDGARDFDISSLAGISDGEYDSLAPIQWPVTAAAPEGTARLFDDGRFFTDNGRARMVPVSFRPPHYATDNAYPLILNTGRTRDHWHTMTRTGKSARLSAHAVEPTLDIHPDDADEHGLTDGALTRLESQWGSAVARVRVTNDQRRGEVFLPIHWTDQFAPRGKVGPLVNPVCDPISGQPESKHTPVTVMPHDAAWHGFALSQKVLEPDDAGWWARAKGDSFWRYEFAGDGPADDWECWARSLLGYDKAPADWIAYHDAATGVHRFAALEGDRLRACLFVARAPDLPSRAWLAGLFARDALTAAERATLLAGRPPSSSADEGPTVCACFGVGRDRIAAAIREKGLMSVEEVGALLSAGTNCGSCRPEIAGLLNEVVPDAARSAA